LSFSTDDFAKALEQHDYQFQKGQVVRGTVANYDSDGIYIDIGGKAAAFLPIDEASTRRITNAAEKFPAGEEFEFLIIQEQNADGQVTLSIRQLELRRIWKQLIEWQETKETVQARVNGVNRGGVTVDVLGLRGFIPRSHLVERDNLDSLIGKGLTVAVLDVIPKQKKLVLSQRLASQGANLGQLEVGQLVEGKVSGIRPFGAFVDFEGTTGLLHVNQISKNYVKSIETVLQPGQPIKALILEIDEVKKRVSLSTKVLESYPGEMIEKMDEVMEHASERAEKAQKMIEARGVESVES
jgi:small subunit ribosomal protein S1